MSNQCVTLCQTRKVGSATKKAVLIYLADRASDDGSGIWTSKAHIAADTEFSKRSVQNAMAELERDGILKKVGTKACSMGFTYEYRLVIEAVEQLESTRPKRGAGDSRHGVQEIHPWGAGDSPKPPLEPPLEPSNICKGGDDLFSKQEIEKTSEVERDFEEWWKTYPPRSNRPSKKQTLKSYRTALKKVRAEELLRATQAYARTRDGEDPQFTAMATRWLKEERWEPFLSDPEPVDPRVARLRRLAAETPIPDPEDEDVE